MWPGRGSDLTRHVRKNGAFYWRLPLACWSQSCTTDAIPSSSILYRITVPGMETKNKIIISFTPVIYFSAIVPLIQNENFMYFFWFSSFCSLIKKVRQKTLRNLSNLIVFNPYLLKTRHSITTWTELKRNISRSFMSIVHVIRVRVKHFDYKDFSMSFFLISFMTLWKPIKSKRK